MTTTDNDTLHRLYDAITVGSKRFSGIVGDAKHAASGGYHIGRAFVPASDYSAGGGGRNASPRDRGGDADVSCAIDVSFSTADMITVTRRLLAAAGTPALRGVREFNGTVDGRTTLNRDAVLGWRQNYTPDDTHLWHIHVGFFRDTAQDWDTIGDVAAVINGTALHTSSGTATPIDTSEEDDMPLTPNQAAALDWIFAHAGDLSRVIDRVDWVYNRTAGITPDSTYFTVDAAGDAHPANPGDPDARPIALLNTMDGNYLAQKLASIEAAVKPTT